MKKQKIQEEKIEKEKVQNQGNNKKHNEYISFLSIVAALDLLVIK
ncbi:hypothetical protein [Clostridium sp. Marseille-Q2269]|nr:hypothetical protein [Clostridium sp. Marseille-Q2269]